MYASMQVAILAHLQLGYGPTSGGHEIRTHYRFTGHGFQDRSLPVAYPPLIAYEDFTQTSPMFRPDTKHALRYVPLAGIDPALQD